MLVVPAPHWGICPQSGQGALQTCAVRAPHTWPPVHAPQSIEPPQPSPTTPQYLPFACWHAMGVHAPESGAEPHTLGMPSPPQVCGLTHPPQSCCPPQPLPTMPQYLPFICAHATGVHAPESSGLPHTLVSPP